jgi:hypothetical protein
MPPCTRLQEENIGAAEPRVGALNESCAKTLTEKNKMNIGKSLLEVTGLLFVD